MKKDKIFFGEQGFTSTSANHICNLAKEYVANVETYLNSISFVKESVSLIGSNNTDILQEGIDDLEINDIPKLLQTVAEAKSLIAWLREAIKAKKSLSNSITATDINTWAEFKELTLPKQPAKESSITEDDYISTLSIKERNRYYELETLCAVLGKYIHPDGALSNARKKLTDKILHPTTVSGNGRDTLIYKYTATVADSNVEALFFKLQNQHREAQAELNGIKHKMEVAISLDESTKQSNYEQEWSNYSNQMKTINEEFTLWKQEQQIAVQNLKIVIPNSLTDIYNKVANLGKKK